MTIKAASQRLKLQLAVFIGIFISKTTASVSNASLFQFKPCPQEYDILMKELDTTYTKCCREKNSPN